MYPTLAKDSNFFEMVFPVTHYWKNHVLSMTLDFNLMEDSSIFSAVALNKLKQLLGMAKLDKVTAKHPLKLKLEKMLATGKYNSKTELARAAGLNDSYVCRILKHRKWLFIFFRFIRFLLLSFSPNIFRLSFFSSSS